MSEVLPPVSDRWCHPGAHSVICYERAEALLRELDGFICRGLARGGTAIAIARPDRIEYLQRRAREQGLDVSRLITLDAAETLALFMRAEAPDPELFEATVGQCVARAAEGGHPVHAFGEMVAILCDRGNYEGALALERLWEGVVARHSISLLCAYPWRLFSKAEHGPMYQSICEAHHHVWTEPGEREEDVSRRMAILEQRARALEEEVQRRREAEQTLRRRERELADFVENAVEGLHKVDGNGVILWANRAELRMLGYSAEEYIGRHIADFHVDAPVIADILRRLVSGQTIYDQPARLRCKDGGIRHVVIHSNGYFEGGRLLYTRCFTRDVTEQVLARQRLERYSQERERLLAELNHASRAKDEFLAMLSHELRNPLSPIVTALEIIRMRGEHPAERELAIVQRQVNHLVRLVEDLLDVSRIIRGRMELRKQRVVVHEVMTKAVEMVSVLLEQRSHQLAVDVPLDLALTVDPLRLAQIAANLLSNAARYTPQGGRIWLKAWEADGMAHLSVRDNGRGIPPELLPRLFELFYQGKRGHDRAEGGLGIGLALVKSFVEAHGGRVEARSEGPGKGAEFVVQLPLEPADEGEVEASVHEQVARVQEASTRKGRVVIVDDNADGAAVMADLLRAWGHEVHVYLDPLSALDAVEGLRPQVAFLDIGLPVVDGYELARGIRRMLGEDCLLVAVTGYGRAVDRQRSNEAGFARHLVKPVRAHELRAVMQALDDRAHPPPLPAEARRALHPRRLGLKADDPVPTQAVPGPRLCRPAPSQEACRVQRWRVGRRRHPVPIPRTTAPRASHAHPPARARRSRAAGARTRSAMCAWCPPDPAW